MHEDIQEMFLVWRFIFLGNLKRSLSSAAEGVAVLVPLHTEMFIPSLGE